MAALLNHIGHMLDDPMHESIEHGLDRIALAKLFEDLGKWNEAAQLYERGLQDGLPETDFWQAVKRLSILQRRRGDLRQAVKLWEQAAADGHVYACVELAKHHEHRRRDPVEALRWTERAVELLSEQDIPRYIHNHWMAELQHRRGRLKTKSDKKQC
jgi:TPR repeat protein